MTNTPLPVIFILALSIIIQAAAAVMAIRLIGVTGRRFAWSLIAAALMLMAVRRVVPLCRLIMGDVSLPPDPLNEIVGLAVSVAMAAGIARIAPLFIERKRSEEALAERVMLAELSADIGSSLTKQGDLRSVLNGCAEALVRRLDVAFARIWTLSDAENVLELQASAGMYTRTDGFHSRIPVGTLKIGRIAEERMPHVTNAVIGDPRVHDQDWAEREGMVAFAGHPLTVEDRLVGVMAMFSRKRLTHVTLKALASVSNEIAIGIERKRMEQQHLAHLRYFEGMDRINRAIQGTDDLEQMMGGVLEAVLSIFDCDRAWLFYPNDPAAPSFRVPMEITKPEYPGAGVLNVDVPMPPDMAQDLLETLESSEPVTFVVGTERPVNRVSAEQFGVKSMMMVALYPKSGKPWAFGLHQCFYSRVWTPEELRLFQEISRRLADGLTGLLSHRDLQESEAKYRRIVDTTSEGIWGLGADVMTTFVNARMADMLGYSGEEMAGRPMTDFMFEEDVPDHLKRMERRRQGLPETYERRFRRNDGQTLWTLVSATPIFDDERHFNGTFGMFTDITERKRAEEALRESEEKYRLLVANASEAIFIAQDGVIQFPNARTLELTGYSAGELAKIPFAQLIHPDERAKIVERYTRQLGGKERTETHRFRIIDKQGKHIWVELTAARITWEERAGVLCFVRDMTEEKKLESQFLQSQKMEAVGQLAGGVAHDFNNLLQVILGYVELLRENLGQDTADGEALGMVHQAAERAADLTRQLLTFSRRQVLQPIDLDLNDLIQGVLKMIRRVIGEDIEFSYMPGARLCAVHADKGQLEQVLMNLCVNARDAMPAGGTLTIETEGVVLDADYCREHPWALEGGYVLLSVTDTGVGMDEATRAQVFEPFFTTKEVGKGTGLGLATVYGIVKQHNGLIYVYSEPGRGTAFKIYIPVAERVTEVVESKIEGRGVGGTESILVAEDEEAVRKLVSRLLEAAGYTVLTARDGEDALRMFDEYGDSIDMALLDVIMPKLGGRGVMDRIRAKRPDMRVLFASGYSENALDTNFVAKEGLRLITKPYRKADLLRAIRETLDAP